jgi:hypothetical protein
MLDVDVGWEVFGLPCAVCVDVDGALLLIFCIPAGLGPVPLYQPPLLPSVSKIKNTGGNTIYLIYLKIVTAIQLWLPYEMRHSII